MDVFWNAVKARASALDGLGGQARFGLVSSFDPQAFAARVLVQPENILTGWLPVLAPWVGAGWGLAAPLSPGDQVLMLCQEGDSQQGVIVGAVWSAATQAPGAPVGECWLVHASGSFVKLQNDGTITLKAPTVSIKGNLLVSGEISDLAGQHGSLDRLRQAYDGHVHADPQGGSTGPVSESV
jgi:phage baseplate assembly protein gpV